MRCIRNSGVAEIMQYESEMPIGLVRIYWKKTRTNLSLGDKGCSVACVYEDADGCKWIAASDRCGPFRLAKMLCLIDRFDLITKE